jgi:hypothetical protein
MGYPAHVPLVVDAVPSRPPRWLKPISSPDAAGGSFHRPGARPVGIRPGRDPRAGASRVVAVRALLARRSGKGGGRPPHVWPERAVQRRTHPIGHRGRWIVTVSKGMGHTADGVVSAVPMASAMSRMRSSSRRAVE